MDNQKSAFWKNNMNYGAITGFSIIILSLVVYFINIEQDLIVSLLIYVIQIIVIVLGTKHLRDKIQKGPFSYGRALASGVLISLFASVIVAFYMLLFFKIIDPDAIEKIFTAMEDSMYEKGMPDDQIEMAMEMSKKFTTPFTIAIGTVFSYTLWGFIFSLIIAAFLKKKSNGYNQAIAEIENEIGQNIKE